MDKIRILSWNVNGIRAVHKKGFGEWFKTEQPDILCVQETKAVRKQVPRDIREFEGYHTYLSEADRKGYSGVALYTRIKPEKVEYGFGIDKFDLEGRTLIADYGDFVLFNIYFPNGKMSPERLQYKMDFYDAFMEYADKLKDEGKNIVVCGDVNTAHKEIDLARPKENEKISGFLPEERAWIDEFLNHGYVDTFREFNQEEGQYTWWSYRTRARDRNVGWRLDYFFVNEEFMNHIKSSFILKDVMGSDHCPVGIEVVLGD
ncbi:exodeoxyribonuclease III [Methanobacterium paludis]|uniref:Exodeoxyribonuclease III n=1 Tax=Methanobacterium paludis (strain DSM 25820 / JCM 18151 / SWAN1) TaxID=868131 RepID=F6D1L0_METPW|nr:exodeoxyribonuclease III [Methanobacterium paludis]AEG17238.1 exodeoxyribonuclease III [Methanobacterium paludis]